MKTRDPLESFVHRNKDAFDDSLPPSGVWEKINDELDNSQRKIIPWKRYMWRAAAVLIIFTFSWFIHDMVDRNTELPGNNELADNTSEYAPAAKELLEAEVYYSAQISSMEDDFITLTQDQPELRRDVFMEMSELDSVYVELKRDLRDQTANEEILEAMIQNYRVKIMILDKMLQQLEGANAREEKEVNYEI